MCSGENTVCLLDKIVQAFTVVLWLGNNVNESARYIK